MESLPTDFFLEFLEAHPKPPERIILDFAAAADPIHGDQLGRLAFFAAGSVVKLAGLVERIRRR